MQLGDWWQKKRATLKDDLIAGLIVAIVALPLAIGFAIASNVDPAMGVVTAIIGGFFAAAFGGSEYQISGPTGAMVVVVLSVVTKYGVDGLILATFVAGIILLLLALFKLGKIIEYIPSPVIVGFTAGIAFIIFFGQLNNLLGITPIYPEGSTFIQQTFISIGQVAQANSAALIIAFITFLILILTPKVTKKIPGSIIAVVATTLLALTSFFDVRTVADIGKIPQGLPIPHLPALGMDMILGVLPAALTIAALAAIESLLSAVVADGLTDTKHKPNKELFGQGIANIASSLFGGMPVTGAIARTATNIRNGGKTRLTGMFHALFLLLFVLAIGGLAALIPLATLAGILMFVAFNMVEWERIFLILKTPLSDIAVMVTTFLITVLVDLTAAIEVGLILAAILFMKRMADLYKVEELEMKTDQNEVVKGFMHKDISIYTISGPLFFGAASRFDQMVANAPGGHKPIKIIRMKYVPVIDATGLNFIESTAHKHRKMGGVVLFSSVNPDVMKIIQKASLDREVGLKHFFPTTSAALVHALKHAHRLHGEDETVTEEELNKYRLSKIDLEDAAKVAATKDRDPVEEILSSLGIMKIQEMSKHSIRTAQKVSEQGIQRVGKIGKKGFDKISGMMPIKKK